MSGGTELGVSDQRRRFGDAKVFAVPDSLDALRGPANGPVTLSEWVYWAPGDATFDVGTDLGVNMAYTAVLSEGELDDVCNVVNAGRLREIWSNLLLPTRCHARWLEAFPEREPK